MPHDKSVLMIGNFLSASLGSRGVCEDFAERLANAGWCVHTASDKPGRLMRLFDMLATVWRKRNQYRFATVDVFSGLAFVWAELVTFLLARLGKQYVLILHGGSLPEFSKRWPGRVSRLLGSAAYVTAPSSFLLEKMQPYYDDIRFLSNPIDINKYRYAVRGKISPNFVWLRAFHEIYNPLLCIRVFHSIHSKYPSARLTMIGPDKGDGCFDKARALSNALGVTESIIWTGKIPNADVSNWLGQSDVFLNTTDVDNTPVSVMEAMACGLCIVSTNVGGLPHLLADNENALLVPPNDPQAMEAAICRLLTDPYLAQELSANARQKAEQFDWAVILPQWESLFREISLKGNL